MNQSDHPPLPEARPAQGSPAIPEPPRPVTPRVSQRLWQEPPVRFWWLVGMLLALVTLGLALSGAWNWWRENALVRTGVSVQAKGYDVAQGSRLVGRPLPVNERIQIEYEHNGRPYAVMGTLLVTGTRYISGEPFEIRIDPKSPEKWTNRLEAAPFGGAMLGAVIALAGALVCLATAAVMRRRYLTLWVHGTLQPMRVLEHRTAAVAPRSVILRCTQRTGRRQTPISVYVAQGSGVPAVGEVVSLIVNESGTTGLALSNYHP